jgi:tetratricopeptide (TPR) repeat protein
MYKLESSSGNELGLVDLKKDSSRFQISSLLILLISIGLVAMVCAVFGQASDFGFIGNDDDQNISLIPEVTSGISVSNIAWAFTHSQVYRWTPLATISRQLDCQYYGLWAGGHHLTNLLLHACATVLCFLTFRSLTCAVWKSALVAALFAIHPLHVESVAWISCRSELLYAVFFITTLWLYSNYVSKPSSLRYGLAIAAYLAGLLSKPMIVTLPLVLLILDYWPLGRLRKVSNLPKLLYEKAPFFFLSFLAVIVASRVQQANLPSPNIPVAMHITLPLVGYATYLLKCFWPAGISFYNPFPIKDMVLIGCSIWELVGYLFLIVAITLGVFCQLRNRGYLMMGWIWYLITLAPVCGLVFIGYSSLAYHYTYVPIIGIFIMFVWMAGEWVDKSLHRRTAFIILAICMLTALSISSYFLTSSFHNKITHWTSILQFNKESSLIENNLGSALTESGYLNEACKHYREALRIEPQNALAHNNFALSLVKLERRREAIAEFREAIYFNPKYTDAYNNLGTALMEMNQLEEAIHYLLKALELNPNYPNAHTNLGNIFLKQGKYIQAIKEYNATTSLNPSSIKAHFSIAFAHWMLGKQLCLAGERKEGIAHLYLAVKLNDRTPEMINDLSWMLATAPENELRDGASALQLADQVNKLTEGKNPYILDTLAAAYAEIGDFAKALETAQAGLKLAEASGNKELAFGLKKEIALYYEEKPFRQP